MEHKTILITGSTDGIGKQTAIELARMGARVIVHGRNAMRVKSAAEEVARISGRSSIESVACDLSSLRAVNVTASELSERFPRIDVLINNAGVFMNERVLTADGYEMTFAVNHLAHFLLTLRLLPVLRRSTPARIITVSSVAHGRGTIDLSDLHGGRRFDGYAAYAASKLANVFFSAELAARLDGSGVTSNSLHPGVITTKLLQAGFNMEGANLEEGAKTSVFLASSPSVAALSGQYFVNEKATAPSRRAEDLQLQKHLWNHSEALVERAIRR